VDAAAPPSGAGRVPTESALKPTLSPAGAAPAEALSLGNWKLLGEFRTALERAVEHQPLRSSWGDPRRQATAADHLSLLLFGLLNPVLAGLRALSAASGLARVQREVCGARISRSSLSEAQHLLEPELLARVFAGLSAARPPLRPDDPLGWLAGWHARDSTVLAALPRMAWAVYGGGRPGAQPSRAVRLHLELDLHEAAPRTVQITPGKASEPAVWARTVQSGDQTVADRGYGQNLRQLARLAALDVRYVVRVRAGVTQADAEALAVSVADRAAGVVADQWVRLGQRRRLRVRLVRVRRGETGEELLLATNLGPERLPGELVSVLYRHRWQVELFFRWFKCVLGAGRHWPWESAGGVAVQLYLALIAGVLLSQRLGRRPRQREWELLQLYFLGWASPAELPAGLGSLAVRGVQG
jgi:Transposase DDE domain